MKREILKIFHGLLDYLLLVWLWDLFVIKQFNPFASVVHVHFGEVPLSGFFIPLVCVFWKSYKKAYSPLKKHLRPFSSWSLGVSSLTISLCTLFFLRGFFVFSFPDNVAEDFLQGVFLLPLAPAARFFSWWAFGIVALQLNHDFLSFIYRKALLVRGIKTQVWWFGEKEEGDLVKNIFNIRYIQTDVIKVDLGQVKEIESLIEGKLVYLVIAEETTNWEDLRLIKYAGYRWGIPVKTLPRLEGYGFVSVDETGLPLMGDHFSLVGLPARIAKRFFDLVFGLVLFGVFLAPMFLVALLIFITDRGNPFFIHQRLGRSGRKFGLFKFRTMQNFTIEEVLQKHPELKKEFQENHKIENDPRVTSLGKFLRKTSIDELPQLLNVVLGDMSLVGPRPVVNEELQRYGDWQDLLLSAKPGVTGLWQVSGRSNLSYDARVRLDTWYVQNWSPWEDFRILILTIPAVLNKKGAV